MRLSDSRVSPELLKEWELLCRIAADELREHLSKYEFPPSPRSEFMERLERGEHLNDRFLAEAGEG
jgi:hypothetical protein